MYEVKDQGEGGALVGYFYMDMVSTTFVSTTFVSTTFVAHTVAVADAVADSGTYRHIQAHTGTYRHIQAHTGTYRHIQAQTVACSGTYSYHRSF
jgi:hypothetical protein